MILPVREKRWGVGAAEVFVIKRGKQATVMRLTHFLLGEPR
jgi:hypothetical protein